MRPTWRCIHSGAATGAFNMAADDLMLRRAAEAGRQPVLRFFGWNPPAVTLGYNQAAERELDLERCRAAGVDVVRRLTGGRAVLHWAELTYSLAWPEGALGATVEESFQLIARGLVQGLRHCGVEASLERSQAGHTSRRGGRTQSPPCFASISRWEVKYRGRKLVGSAQRQVKGAVLQHGSLLLGPEHKRLLDLLSGDEDHVRRRRELDRGSVDLRSAGGPLDPALLADALGRGLAETAQIHLRRDDFDALERRAIDDLLEGRYTDAEWHRAAAPAGGEAPIPELA